MDFLWDGLSWLASRILVDRIPFLSDQFLDFQNFIGAFHIKSAPPATEKSYPTLPYWYFVIFLRSSIGKLGSSFARSVS